MTARTRMEALGWHLDIDDHTCEAAWLKIDASRIVMAYQREAQFSIDLDACQREACAAGETED